ncbi:nucleotidyltransferase domain-containing protein [Breznakiellaceae bacterium SP9]
MLINDEILAIRDLIIANSDCEKVFLFGSYAYGVPHEDSDYDFYVVLSDHAKNPMLVMQDLSVFYGRRRLGLWKQNERLDLKRKIMSVDFVAQYSSRFEERCKDYPFEHTIAEKGVLLYDKYAIN